MTCSSWSPNTSGALTGPFTKTLSWNQALYVKKAVFCPCWLFKASVPYAYPNLAPFLRSLQLPTTLHIFPPCSSNAIDQPESWFLYFHIGDRALKAKRPIHTDRVVISVLKVPISGASLHRGENHPRFFSFAGV